MFLTFCKRGKQLFSTNRIIPDSKRIINDKIPHKTIQLVTEKGNHISSISLHDALKMFDSKDSTLAIVNAQQNPPVCKILPKKQLFQQQKQKKQKPIQTKELDINSNIAKGDLETKINQSKGFLIKGHRVRFNVTFRGERTNVQLLDIIVNELQDFGQLVGDGSQKGKQLTFELKSKMKKLE